MTAHQAEFQARIARINAGQGYTKSTVYVGMDTAFSYMPPNRRKAGLGFSVPNAGQALSFPLAMLVGFLCHGVERYADFRVFGLPDIKALTDVQMAKMAAIAFAMTLLVTHVMGLRDRELLLAKVLGVAAGMLFFHNLVHARPDVFEQIYSPNWVGQVMASTESGSLNWGDVSFKF